MTRGSWAGPMAAVWGLVLVDVDLVQRLVNLPQHEQLQTQLSRRYIQQEVAVLSRASAQEATTLETATLEIDQRGLVIQHADVVNIHVNAGSGADGS